MNALTYTKYNKKQTIDNIVRLKQRNQGINHRTNTITTAKKKNSPTNSPNNEPPIASNILQTNTKAK